MIEGKKIRFSITIPAYKSRYLREAIDSCLAQTYENFELIIVDDASPFDLKSIVTPYLKDSRVSYYRNEINCGAINVVDNWNICLSYAKGDYVICMGDDDVLEPDYLTEFSNLILKYPEHDVYHCRSYTINELSQKVGLTPSWPERESVYENIWHRLNGYREQFVSDFVYNTNALKGCGGFYKMPLAWGSDDITSYIVMGKKGIAHTNKPVFNYRKNSQSITSSGNLKLKMEAILLEKSWVIDFIQFEPANSIDTVFRSGIVSTLEKSMQRKKHHIMIESYKVNGIKQLYYWYSVRKEIGISISEILYSIIGYLRFNKSQKLFKKTTSL